MYRWQGCGHITTLKAQDQYNYSFGAPCSWIPPMCSHASFKPCLSGNALAIWLNNWLLVMYFYSWPNVDLVLLTLTKPNHAIVQANLQPFQYTINPHHRPWLTHAFQFQDYHKWVSKWVSSYKGLYGDLCIWARPWCSPQHKLGWEKLLY